MEIIEGNSSVHNFSGGEKIKYALLLELMKNPTILILDEPTNDLDIESVKTIENFIQTTMLPVYHRTKPFYTIADIGYKEYVTKCENLIDRQFKLANSDKAEFDKKMRKYQKVYEMVQHDLRSVSRGDPSTAKNLKDKMHTVKSMGKRYEKEKNHLRQKPTYEEVIDFTFNNVKIPNKREVLKLELPILKVENRILSKNIELYTRGPEKICIVGKNGAGKSTLLNIIMNELEKSKIRYGYMPQDYLKDFDIKLTPVEFLCYEFTKSELTLARIFLGSLKFTSDEITIDCQVKLTINSI